MKDLPFVAILLSILTFGYTFWKDIRLERRLKQVEDSQEKERKAEAIRRSKASAPYFVLSPDLFGRTVEQGEKGEAWMWRTDGGNILYQQRHEVSEKLEANDPVVLVIENIGKDARKIHLSGDITGIALKVEPPMDPTRRLFFKYPFVPANRGKVEKIIISFETEDGYDMTHTYQTRHGFFELARIDPP